MKWDEYNTIRVVVSLLTFTHDSTDDVALLVRRFGRQNGRCQDH